VLWWRRTGVPWRELPVEFGSWKTVFNRFDRWAKRGKWKDLLDALQTDRDDEWHSVDSTIHRAHQHAAGAKGGKQRRLWGGRAGDYQRKCCSAVIPSKASRAQRIPFDNELYKARSAIECTFNLLKQARRFATRYEKTLRNYQAVVALGGALLWLRIQASSQLRASLTSIDTMRPTRSLPAFRSLSSSNLSR